MRADGDILLLSVYELGHQPLHLASPLGFLERAGYRPRALDLAVAPLDEAAARRARFVGIAVPMHTALRLGAALGARVKALNPAAHLCYYGLYAPLNRDYLRARGADSVLGGEYEDALVAQVAALEADAPAAMVKPLADAVTAAGDVAAMVRPLAEAVTAAGDVAAMVKPLAGPAPAAGDVAAMVKPLAPRHHLPVAAEGAPPAGTVLERLDFAVPARAQLAPLGRYARLELDGEARLAGYTEASRGCLHGCRHCPIPPVYQRRFFVVPLDVVLADVERQVAAGARHITLGDADFFNGPRHALAVARALHERHPALTFDVTIKIEHLLAHRALLPELRRLGCAFVVSAVESLSDDVLAILDKGHTRADVEAALALLDDAGLPLRPTWIPFTPWSTLADYVELFDWIAARGLVDHVDPIQLAIRLLVPPGSLLLARPELQAALGPLEPERLSYRWTHPDARMDQLAHDALAAVSDGAGFAELRALAERAAGSPPRRAPVEHGRVRGRPPRLSEAWFC